MSRKNKIIFNKRKYDSIEEIAANESPLEDLLGKANVVSAKAGTKIKGGVDTKEPCVVIGVIKKLDKKDLKKKDIILRELFNGAITDVVQVPMIRSLNCESMIPTPDDPRDKYRPLQGGISSMVHTGTACTLSLLVTDSLDESVVALHNNHCLGLLYDPEFETPTVDAGALLDVAGALVLQPSPYDGGNVGSDFYGEVKRCEPIKFGMVGTNLVDGGIASIYSKDDYSSKIISIGIGPYPFSNEDGYETGHMVTKSGRTTCVTTGIITSKNLAVNVNYGSFCSPFTDSASFTNQIEITGLGYPFLQGGDSGSILLANVQGIYQVIGLCFAGGGDVGIANKIEDVVLALNISEYAEAGTSGVLYSQPNSNISVELGSEDEETISQSVYMDYGFSMSQISIGINEFRVDYREDIEMKIEVRQALGSENRLDLSMPILYQTEWREDMMILEGSNNFAIIAPGISPPGYYWVTIRLNRTTTRGTWKIAAQRGGPFLNKFIKLYNGLGEYRDDISLELGIAGYWADGSDLFSNRRESLVDDQYLATTIKDED